MTTGLYSDCCDAPIPAGAEDQDLCPKCHDHCAFVRDQEADDVATDTFPTPGYQTRGTPTTPSPDLLAAETVAPHTKRMRDEIMRYMQEYPDDAWGADQMAGELGMHPQTCRARFSELYALGMVNRRGHQRTSTGSKQWAYVALPPPYTPRYSPPAHSPAPEQIAPPRGDSHRLVDRIRVHLVAMGAMDWTADEVAHCLNISPRSVRPRFIELQTYGIIERTGGTRPSAKGKPMAVYHLTRKEG
jgi:AraC-like DNA-binding protein